MIWEVLIHASVTIIKNVDGNLIRGDKQEAIDASPMPYSGVSTDGYIRDHGS